MVTGVKFFGLKMFPIASTSVVNMAPENNGKLNAAVRIARGYTSVNKKEISDFIRGLERTC